MTYQGDQRVFQPAWRAEREAPKSEPTAAYKEAAIRPCRPEGRLYE